MDSESATATLARPGSRLVECAERLFYAAGEASVFNTLVEIEQPVFNCMARDTGVVVTDTYKQKVFQLWEVYAKQSTCIAPPWRDNYSRIVIASTEANRLLTELVFELSPPQRALLLDYNLDLNIRYIEAAKIQDEKFKKKATVALSVIGFVAAVAAASRR